PVLLQEARQSDTLFCQNCPNPDSGMPPKGPSDPQPLVRIKKCLVPLVAFPLEKPPWRRESAPSVAVGPLRERSSRYKVSGCPQGTDMLAMVSSAEIAKINKNPGTRVCCRTGMVTSLHGKGGLADCLRKQSARSPLAPFALSPLAYFVPVSLFWRLCAWQ